jgi:flagellar hook-basal body complex protein FliE
MTNATIPALRAETADMTVLGSLPLLQGENDADYERLRAAVITEMRPADLMEMIWTNDIIYLEWEIIRFRRAKANYLRHLASPDLISGFNLKKDEKGPHMDLAKGVAANIHSLELLERMIASMEQRRNAAYHQAEQRRVNLGNRLRQVVTQVEDAEFRELDDQPTDQKSAT